MFGEQLKNTMSLLEVTGRQLAKYIECDPSGISRMVSGGRIPAKNGKTARRVVERICSLAQETGKMDELRRLIACEFEDENAIQEALVQYLYDNVEGSKREARHKKKLEGDRVFGDRFDALMNISSFSNAHFARIVNMDPSYISRFRKGLRTARSSPENVDRICRTFLERIQKLGKLDELAHTMRINKKALLSDEAPELLSDWLCREPDDTEIEKLESLITNIINVEKKYVQPQEETITYEIRNCYIGLENFKMACYRLLEEALTDGTTDLYFYDDASTRWIDMDDEYRQKWRYCIGRCIAKGIHIHNIHILDRDMNELVTAISHWLPLYLSGLVESDYCIRERNNRFTNTLFLSDRAVIEGSNVAACNNLRMFTYHTDPEEVRLFHEQFNVLRGQSRELVRPFLGLRRPLFFESHVKVVRNTLSIATMTLETLNKVMDHNHIEGEERELIVKEWTSISGMFDRATLNGTFEEYSILDPHMNLDILRKTLKYDAETYTEHMQEIIRKLKKYPGYRFYVLSSQILDDCRLGLTDHTIVVTRLKQPTLTFFLSHPRMIQAVRLFIDRLDHRECTEEELSEYLASISF